MQRTSRWYSAFFGLPLAETSHEGKIYDLPVEGETGVILDAHQPVRHVVLSRQGSRTREIFCTEYRNFPPYLRYAHDYTAIDHPEERHHEQSQRDIWATPSRRH